MPAHWKHGDNFSIRYGGPSGIQWFSGPASGERPAVPGPGGGAGSIQILIQAVGTIAQVGTWYEVRKQSAILAAEFEERRLLWCSDLLATLAAEVRDESVLRPDTVRHLELELRRTLAVLPKNSKMDVPYAFVLQCERMARGIAALNRVMYSELRRDVSDAAALPYYVPAEHIRALLPPHLQKPAVLDRLRAVLPALFGDDSLMEVLRTSKRDPQLVHVEDLALELRSATELLQASRARPITERNLSEDETISEPEGVAQLATALGVPALLGSG